MSSADYWSILRCPITAEPLQWASPSLLMQVNQAIDQGRLFTRQGARWSRPCAAGFLNRSGTWFYPVIDEIPQLLPGLAIPIVASGSTTAAPSELSP